VLVGRCSAFLIAMAEAEALDELPAGREARREANSSARGALLTAIANTPATTPEGLQAKAAATRRQMDNGDPTPSEALAFSLTTDVLRGVT
jgi:hypothetical protein